MARPIKESLNYFSLDTDFFRDRKVNRLLKTFGGKGTTIFVFLLCEIYRENGYYLKWDDHYPQDIMNALGTAFSYNFVSDVVSLCLRIELFDKKMFSRFSILTSAGIQKRYVLAKGTINRKPYNPDELLIPEYNLISNDGSSTGFNGVKRSLTTVTTSKVKESKVNKSKVKESKENEKNIFNAEAFGVKTQPELQPTLELPDCLKTPAFKAAWLDWIDYKKQRRETYKSAGAKALLKKLAEFGPDEAIKKIETAMANNWAGCVFDSPKKQNRNDTSSVISSVAERLKRIESGATEQ